MGPPWLTESPSAGLLPAAHRRTGRRAGSSRARAAGTSARSSRPCARSASSDSGHRSASSGPSPQASTGRPSGLDRPAADAVAVVVADVAGAGLVQPEHDEERELHGVPPWLTEVAAYAACLSR